MLSDFGSWRLGAPLIIGLIIVVLVVLAFEIWMIVDAVKNKFITTNTKVWWIVGMFLIHPIVAIIYFFTDHKKTQ